MRHPGGMSYVTHRKGADRVQGRESHVAFFLERVPQVGESLERETGLGGSYGYGGLGEWF